MAQSVRPDYIQCQEWPSPDLSDPHKGGALLRSKIHVSPINLGEEWSELEHRQLNVTAGGTSLSRLSPGLLCRMSKNRAEEGQAGGWSKCVV
jgi:hypothetical protein